MKQVSEALLTQLSHVALLISIQHRSQVLFLPLEKTAKKSRSLVLLLKTYTRQGSQSK